MKICSKSAYSFPLPPTANHPPTLLLSKSPSFPAFCLPFKAAGCINQPQTTSLLCALLRICSPPLVLRQDLESVHTERELTSSISEWTFFCFRDSISRGHPHNPDSIFPLMQHGTESQHPLSMVGIEMGWKVKSWFKFNSE